MTTDEERRVTLHGRVFIKGDIKAKTGLHIGGAAGALEIGGVDSPVVRDPLTNWPYIPGSSLRGKMRSLTERLHGSHQNFHISRVRGKEVLIHTCQAGTPPADDSGFKKWKEKYQMNFVGCPVCSVFGVTGDEPVPHPTSLVVRDVYLSEDSAKKLEKADTDYPLTEIKWEATIDRVTSAAVPRQIERVPANAIFEGFELVFNIYDQSGRDHFPVVLKALQLVEEDYLGGLGSRGSGKVEFRLTEVYARKGEDYTKHPFDMGETGQTLAYDLVERINGWVKETFVDVPNSEEP